MESALYPRRRLLEVCEGLSAGGRICGGVPAVLHWGIAVEGLCACDGDLGATEFINALIVRIISPRQSVQRHGSGHEEFEPFHSCHSSLALLVCWESLVAESRYTLGGVHVRPISSRPFTDVFTFWALR